MMRDIIEMNTLLKVLLLVCLAGFCISSPVMADDWDDLTEEIANELIAQGIPSDGAMQLAENAVERLRYIMESEDIALSDEIISEILLSVTAIHAFQFSAGPLGKVEFNGITGGLGPVIDLSSYEDTDIDLSEPPLSQNILGRLPIPTPFNWNPYLPTQPTPPPTQPPTQPPRPTLDPEIIVREDVDISQLG